MKIDFQENFLNIVNGLSLISLVFGLIEGDPIVIDIKVVVGGKAELPCNVTNSLEEDSITLILWYKEGTGGQPIYTMDSRTNLDLQPAGQPQIFTHQLIDSRVSFELNKSSVHGSFLTIDPVISEDNGNYKCRVDFRRGRTQVTNINLFVIVPPEKISIINGDNGKPIVLNNPVSFNENTNVNLICKSYGGRPSPSLVWFFNGKPFDDEYKIIDETSGLVENQLTLANVDKQMLNSLLSCQSSNNNITNGPMISFTLDLNIKPSAVEITNSRQPISAGRKIEIICLATGSRPPARITWFKDDKPMIHSKESYSTDGRVTTSALILMPTRDDNQANIICKADNPRLINSTIQDSWILEVYYDPKVLLSMGNATRAALVKAGDRVELVCNVSANPMNFKVYWYRDGQPFIKHGGIKQSNTTLIIEKARRKDHGRYQCSAINIEGQTMSNIFHLEVHFPPTCKKDQRSVYGVSIGEHITIPCQVEASPDQVDFYWLLNGTIVHDNQSGLPGLKYISQGLTSWLEYKVISKDDFGIFECWSRNAIGSQMEPCLFTLIPSGPPEPLQNCTISDRTDSRLVVKCLPNYDGGLTQTFNIQVQDDERKLVVQNLTLSNSEPPIFNISDLNPDSSYILFLFSSNAKGSSRIISIPVTTLPLEANDNESFNFFLFDSTNIMSAVRLGSISALILLTLVILIGLCIKKHRQLKQTSVNINQSNEILEETFDVNQSVELPTNYPKSFTSGQVNPDVVPSSKSDCNYIDKVLTTDQLLISSNQHHFNNSACVLPSYNHHNNVNTMLPNYAAVGLTTSQGFGINVLDKKLYPNFGSYPEFRESIHCQQDANNNSIILGDLSTRSQLLPRRSFQYATNLRTQQRNVRFGTNISGFSTPV